MPLIERDPALFDDAGDNAGFRRARTDCANTLPTSFSDFVNLRAHLCARNKCITAAIHRRAAGVAGLTSKCDAVTLHAKSAEHTAKRKVESEQDGPLFDVQLDVSSRG